MEKNREISEKISNLAKKGNPFLFIVDFESNAQVYTPAEALELGIYFNSEGYTLYNSPAYSKKPSFGKNRHKLQIKPIAYSEYLIAFNKVKSALQRGDTYLTNLTCLTEIETDYTLREIFELSNARYKLLYKDQFVVFSPERFIRIHNGIIETNPMKGTIDAYITDAEKIVLENQKEHFEHNTIVDLLRNDLNMVATDVKVERFRYVEKVSTHKGDLLQVSSLITGKLPDDYLDHLGEIIFKLLPAGSVTGAPKKRTIEIINDAENYNRGYYTGVFGYFDGKNLDVAVSIRFIEKEGDKLYYKSGGGITALSDPREEYEEMIQKVYLPF